MSALLTRDGVRTVLKKSVAWYCACALTLFNTFVLFVLLNVLLHYAFKGADGLDGAEPPPPSGANPIFEKYGKELVLKAYPDMAPEDVSHLLSETWSVPSVYEPYTLFKERPTAGKWVNVDPNGFRYVMNQGPWPPDPGNVNVFVFGGSTTYGYGVPDWETIPSHLQEILQEHVPKPVRVYNFGRGYYYSTQEKILLERLLGAGHVPHLAVFIDGVNDLGGTLDDDRPDMYQDILEYAFLGPQQATAPQNLLTRLPITRAINHIKLRAGIKKETPQQPQEQPSYGTEELRKYYAALFPRILDRYWANKKMIEAVCQTYRVIPLFVWQPGPTYKYDLRYHLFGNQSPPLAEDPRTFDYPWVAEERAANPDKFAERFVWLADLQEDRKENLYVDQWHYTGKFCHVIAAAIKDYIVQHRLLSAPPP